MRDSPVARGLQEVEVRVRSSGLRADELPGRMVEGQAVGIQAIEFQP